MGNVLSSASTRARTTKNVIRSESETMNDANVSCVREEIKDMEEHFHDTVDDDEARAKAKEEEMDTFRKQLNIKREQRREILTRHRAEKEELEMSLEKERQLNLELYNSNRMLRELLFKNNIEIPENLQSSKEDSDLTNVIAHMRDEFEKLKTNNNKLRRNLTESNSALQSAYSDIADLNAQHTESIKQINALKEVVTVSKTMINLREQQLNELKNKLTEIEQSLADRETSMLSTDLRQEYERQLQNIRTLRGLYEERARLAEVTRQGLVRELEEQKLLNQAEVIKCRNLTENVEELETKVNSLEETLKNKNDQISSCQEETRGIKAEMSVVNKLFSQVLLGYKTKQDLDTLVHRLEENHGLLTQMAEKENGSEGSSALPKLLLELVSQVDEGEEKKDANQNETENMENQTTDKSGSQNSLATTPEEIVQNLPKVWRVLIELLSHQSVAETDTCEKVTTCYKSVETASGPVLVPSVSQTYIRLKDLIMEKLSLIKEVNRMKQLNTHLETRLEEQERRLCLVTTELSKTWHVVGRLRRHHHQLHTHEKILKYELQQKRKLLNELKEELEYCREKWEQAREKNLQSERDWRKLRAEFSSRKTKSSSLSFNNSAESGYSDERPSDDSSESNDESEYVTESLVRCKKKIKKSFETILDSSTDFNLAAEREDPASDMLDVADLPLDTQDCDDNNEASISDNCNSENLLKHEKVCEETEDEIGDITNDSCVEEESSTVEHYCNSDYCCIGPSSSKDNMNNNKNKEKEKNVEDNVNLPTNSVSSDISGSNNNTVIIDPAAILKSIKEQNERLAKKDKKLENLEKSGAALLKKTQTTAKFSEQIDNTLNHLLNRPKSYKNVGIEESEAETSIADKVNDRNSFPSSETKSEETERIIEHNELLGDKNDRILNCSTTLDVTNVSTFDLIQQDSNTESTPEPSCSQIELDPENLLKFPLINSKFTLENIKGQNEQLTKKEQRLQNLGNVCFEDIKYASDTLSVGDEIMEPSDSFHNESSDENILSEQSTKENEEDDSVESKDESEPSTSTEIDHEARFAARDLRLKMLEEQTKSLVNKVNKTTTKGVRIHYKLEELHNIYGSESSRAGTPSEDSENSRNDDETK